MYKYFDVSQLNTYGTLRVGTTGYQPKFITQDGKYFIKQMAVINGDFRNDSLVEVFAYKVATVLGIEQFVVEPKLCILDLGYQGERYGIYSENFERTRGLRFLSFDSLLMLNRDDLEEYSYIRLNTISKLQLLAQLLTKYTGLSIQETTQYMVNLALIDVLICNTDRHFRNFGCCIDVDGNFKIAPIFDNGMGLGEFVSDKRYSIEFTDFLREAYIAPYGENPFQMLHILNQGFGIGKLLKRKLFRLHKFYNSRMCRLPKNAFAELYFNTILAEIERL